MKRFTLRPGPRRTNHPRQLHIDWSTSDGPAPAPAPSLADTVQPDAPWLAPEPAPAPSVPPHVQSLPWDFRATFPQPTPEALDAGLIGAEDFDQDGLRAIHEEHAREALSVLHDLDAVLDARRRGVDPHTGKPPRTHAAQEKLQRLFRDEPDRLNRAFDTLIDVYETAFGEEAADAFTKAIRAWHAGIEVTTDRPSPAVPERTADAGPRMSAQTHSVEAVLDPIPSSSQDRAPPNACQLATTNSQVDSDAASESKRRSVPRRVSTVLPVPVPLPAAVAAGRFGVDAHGPVCPTPEEVRAITAQHADKLIDLLEGLGELERDLNAPVCTDQARLYHERDRLGAQFQSAIAIYAEDFGSPAGKQLEAYVRRQSHVRGIQALGRSR